MHICRLIVENVKDKNPQNIHGWTPLHCAADEDNLEVCRLIIKNVEDKNPSANDGQTPLHLAAERGFLEICRLIVETVEDKNLFDGMTRCGCKQWILDELCFS